MESEFDKNDIVLQYTNVVLNDHQSKKEILKNRLSEKGFYMYICTYVHVGNILFFRFEALPYMYM